MRTGLAAAFALVLLSATPVHAHRLDEYLQATTIAAEKGRIQAQITLAPGVAVFPIVFADLDSDGDGVVSGAEQSTYAQRVLHDLVLSVDGKRLPLRLISSTFAKTEALREGRGEIRLDFEADVPVGGPDRRLTFENHHQRRIGAYLVNGLVPRDPDIRITAQNRDYAQSFYQLDYSDATASSSLLSVNSWSNPWGWLGSAVFGLLGGLALLGRRHAGAHRPLSEK
jgi:hypothetical protein